MFMRWFNKPQRSEASTDRRGFLSRLSRDQRGNVLAMSAAALIPLLAMIGGAIDASRLYMARTRLQQACDAGALAGRKAMANVQTLTTAEKAKAKEFFDFNFPTGTYSGDNINAVYSRGGAGVVVGEASVDMPTTIMSFFGFEKVGLSVSCESTLNIPNTDIMFVLDITGSMSQKPDGTAPGPTEASKLDGLKQAVKDFYAALGPGASTGPGRVRYGFMPYSTNVNVGRILYAANRSYVTGGTSTEMFEYRSRYAERETEHYITAYGTESSQTNGTATTTSYGNWSGYSNSGAVGSYPATYSNLTVSQCNAKAEPPTTTGAANYGSPTRTSDENVAYPDTTQTRYYSANGTATQTEYLYARTGTATSGTCQLQYRTRQVNSAQPSTTTRSVTWADREKFVSWTKKPMTYDVSPFVQNTTPVTNPAFWSGYYTGSEPNEGAPASFSWSGCIQEAKTDPTIGSGSSLVPPSGAYDLNIDLVPNSADTRWKPELRELVYSSVRWFGAGPAWGSCPVQASRLAMYTSDYVAVTKSSATFNAYVDGLTAVGGTYHDLGLIWGSRFLSPDGIFAADNADSAAPGGYQVSRHIVFMTDGTLATNADDYSQWGINDQDGKIGPKTDSNDQLNARHNRRVEIICNAMKGKGFTIWVIGFGSDVTNLPQRLKDCATDADHWSVASDTATLRTRFASIAQTIGGLRLSQ